MDDRDDLDLLIEQYLSGKLTDAEAAALLSRLDRDPSAGHRLLDQLHLDTMLHEVADTPSHAVVPEPSPADHGMGVLPLLNHGRDDRATVYRRPLHRWVAVAASLLVVIGVTWWAIRTPSRSNQAALPSNPATQPAEAITASIAVLTRTVDARWRVEHEATEQGSAPAAPPRVGTALEPGWLRLDAGLAQIEFFNGAQVVLEGPAELQLVSASEAFCLSGKLRAEVPMQARGFRITTPQINVVDRGTSFGVEVSQASANVHVFKGLVELHDRQETSSVPPAAVTPAMRDLTAGQAASVDQAGSIRRLAADATAFATPDDIDRRLNESHRRWLVRWQDASVFANADPSLLVRFDFENAGQADRILTNVAAGAMTDAAIVGCGWSEGRWPGKGALEYRGVGDRVRIELPGELQSITFAAWVRVHGLDRSFNSLFMSDAFGPGSTHWQILRDGRVRLGIGSGKPQDTDSPLVFTPERLGQWIHLAVVYDADAKQITHYVDGRAVSRSSIQPRKLTIGRAELGNWNPATRADGAAIRHFSGRIDEFSAYARALADEEIAAMYAVGAGLTETASP
ncbi:LamG-like jellyroll fold domain-containing protein [Humisphaera borealis]|uniref:FecR domain-containing protein n=1 Tax=Humisphaera borealis TaxID=2807512 RepID=A0A7M2X3Q1_9BACT|nr:LamG-like jellyroll fold domain-containing protein [Humisphaera borealis]QOV92062.1 FecR domain-containing protein [Humisphaera borealis]